MDQRETTVEHQPQHTTEAVGNVDPAPYVDVRQQAVDRLRRMATNLAFHAWEQRFSDPLCPHALAFLYLQHDTRRAGMWKLTAAWQLRLDNPQVRVLPQLLFDLHHQFAPRAAGAGFDVRDELSVGRDEDMADAARTVYAGLGVISLDIPQGAWAQTQRSATTALDVPSRLWAALGDGTLIAGQQLGRTGFHRFWVESSQTLDHPTRPAMVDWTPVDADQSRRHPEHGDIVRWATELSDTLSQADNGRVDALRQRAAGHQARQARPS